MRFFLFCIVFRAVFCIFYFFLCFSDMVKSRVIRYLSELEREAIIKGRERGRTQAELSEQFGVSQSTISNTLKRHRVGGTLATAAKTGRPKVTSSLTDRNILRLSRDDPRLTAIDIAKEVATPGGPNPSPRTVRRRLNDAGLHARRPVKKPLISEKNRRARLAWAHAHLRYTRAQWRRILWSDESKYNLFGSDGQKWVRRPEGTRYHPKYQLPTVKHGGGNVMVWGCFWQGGLGPLVRINGIMDRHVYMDILTQHMRPYALREIGRGFVFQQDNDPKHSSKDVKAWFKRNNVKVIEWPSQSPDLNPIEHLWEELERRCASIKPKNAADKFEILRREWERIPQSVIDTLIDSMPRRCQAVIDNKGFATKY